MITKNLNRTSRRRRQRGEGSVFQRKSDGLWIGRLVQDGRTIQVSAHNAKDAAEALRVARVRAGKIPASRIKVSEWVDNWLVVLGSRVSPGTHERYASVLRKYIVPEIGEMKLANVRANTLRNLETAQIDWSEDTRAVALRVFSKALLEAYRQELIEENPAARIDLPKRPPSGRRTGVSLETAIAVIAAAVGDDYEALYLVLLANALRISEAFGLYPEDIDLQRGRIRIARQLYERKGGIFEQPPKGKKEVTLPLAPITAVALQRYLERRESKLQYLFASPADTPLRRSMFYEPIWQPFLKRAGVPYFVPHQLRHTTGTLLHAVGTPIEVIKDILRHAHVTTTDAFYRDQIPAMQVDALGRLSELLRGERLSLTGTAMPTVPALSASTLTS